MDSPFQFDLYRLVIAEPQRELFEPEVPAFDGDQDILKVLLRATDKEFDLRRDTEKSEIFWALRSYTEFGGTTTSPEVVVLRLGRGIVSALNPTIDEGGIKVDRSEFDPPTADFIHLIFLMNRHLVAVEHRSAVSGSQSWRSATEEILGAASTDLGFSSKIELEPVPGKDKVLKLFFSFDKLTKLSMVLRLPNPEVSRFSQNLFQDMKNGGIREFAQRMYNSQGLSQQPGTLPHAAAELAEAGYKVGDVKMEGVIGGQRKKKKTGSKAIRSSISTPRDLARGMLVTAKNPETKKCLNELIAELDKVSPPPAKQKSDDKPSARSKKKGS